jgi:hypothetical protein
MSIRTNSTARPIRRSRRWAHDDSEPDANAPTEDADLPIFGAVEFRLGLKIEKTKAPVEVR